MSSLTLKPFLSFLTSKLSLPSSSSSSSYSSFSFPIAFPRNTRNALAARLRAYDSSKSDKSDASFGDSKPPNGTLVFPSLHLLNFCASLIVYGLYSHWIYCQCQCKLGEVSSKNRFGCVVFSIMFRVRVSEDFQNG